MKPRRRKPPAFLILCGLALLSGCRSAWIQASIVNQQDKPVTLVIVNYPGGSFGVQSIAAHAAFHYRFHDLGDDKITVDYTDASGNEHTATGPLLKKGQMGTLQIEISPSDTVSWEPHLTSRR